MPETATATIKVSGDWTAPVAPAPGSDASTVEAFLVGTPETLIARTGDPRTAVDADLARCTWTSAADRLPLVWRMILDAGLIDPDAGPGLFIHGALSNGSPIARVTADGAHVLGHFFYHPDRGVFVERHDPSGLLFDMEPTATVARGPKFVVPVTITTSWNHEVVIPAEDGDAARRIVDRTLDTADATTLPGHRLISTSTGVDVGFAIEL